MVSSIYSAVALALLGSYSVLGFEYKGSHQIKAAAFEKSTASARADDYCLIFEDHFNTFDLKNWQVHNNFNLACCLIKIFMKLIKYFSLFFLARNHTQWR